MGESHRPNQRLHGSVVINEAWVEVPSYFIHGMHNNTYLRRTGGDEYEYGIFSTMQIVCKVTEK